MENNQQKNTKKIGIIYLLFAVIIIAVAVISSNAFRQYTERTYSEYCELLAKNAITYARIRPNEEVPTGTVIFIVQMPEGEGTEEGSYQSGTYQVNVTNIDAEREALLQHNVAFEVQGVKEKSYFFYTLLPILMLIIGLAVVIVLMFGRANAAANGNPQIMSFIKVRTQASDPKKNKIRFADVAGLQEEKAELAEVVDFLKAPQKYIDMGARIPKGLLLLGPPGTGKTLLAKAVAGEAGVPFFTISGSDFVEMFVGVGAGRVRDLFDTAKKNSPCIVFIDEIDAVARVRGSGLGGGHDEREQTLNQLLVEMDGFSVNEGIIVLAATNRADILDPAIMRPGRFDRKVVVGLPDVVGREEILQVHAKNKRMRDDVDLKRIARTTAGFSGADLENLLNEAAIISARKNAEFITPAEIEEAFIKVGIGTEKKSRIITEQDKRITAYHEMGHAVLFEALPNVGPVHTISVIPTGTDAAGYTMPLPEKDDVHLTKSRMLEDIMVSMGGRIAEEIVFGDITTGASQDIKQATRVARQMVTKFGMSEKVGFINYEQESDSVFVGRDIGHTKNFGESVYNELEAEVKRIISECYEKAKAIVLEKRDILDKGVAALMEKEKLTTAEFEAIYYGRETE